MTISPNVQKLVDEYILRQKEEDARETGSVISVDAVVVRVASFYEKIRGIVDWREEHLLRKTAIERIVRRRFAFSGFNDTFAENFASELVRGGHLPNNKVSFAKVDEIQAILQKYVSIVARYREHAHKGKKEIEDWLFSIAAVEIEEVFSLPRRERALIELMTHDLDEITEVVVRKKERTAEFPAKEKTLQIYIAVQQALLKLDKATITYHILEKFYTDWKNLPQETLHKIAESLEQLEHDIERMFNHVYAERFYQLAEHHDTPYLILGDILSDHEDQFDQLIQEPAVLEETIRGAYERRHNKLRGRIRRAAVYSTVSVFLTKVVAAIAVEIPLVRYLGETLNPLAVALSITIPPLLMLVLIATAQTTSKQNFERVKMEVIRIIQPREKQDTHKIFRPRKQTGFGATIVYGVYLLSFLISFGVLVWLLERLHFSIFSIGIFVMFLSLVLFAGTRLRQRARELMVEAPKEGFLHNIFDAFSLPMIQVGRWLSGQLVRYNVLVLMLNFLIEVPFQIFVEFLDQWRTFLREKKEEIH
jgi:hypothetical protein